jgi:hypothetical protein
LRLEGPGTPIRAAATDVTATTALDPRLREEIDVPPFVAYAARSGFVSSAVNWRRTIAASVVMMLVTGAAFAAAYWYVRPPADGSLVVQSSVAGVQVLVDGRPRGTTPLKLELSAGRHLIEMRGFGSSRTLPVEITAGVQTTQNVKWPSGRQSGTLKLTSTPPGARVRVDGEMRGVTPVELEGVGAGSHAIVLESDSGVVKRTVNVEPGETTAVEASIFSGWLTVFAPFRVSVFEDGALLGTSEDGKLLLPCGTHTLDLVNNKFGVRETRVVEISPGGTTPLSFEAPRGAIDVEAPDGTEVWVDGELKGTVPTAPIQVPVGTHTVVLRPPQLAGRSVPVEVVAKRPTRVTLFEPR